MSAIETLSVDPIDVSHASGQVCVGSNPGVPHIHNILEKINKGKKIGIPYQNIINFYLQDCSQSKKKPKLKWAS
ncbi:MAG: hypothetical protein L6302_05330 [Desulfobacteraceae bacterium]|nr:hypothetical protein [Desulfobacteraceae bacterium]